MGRNLQSHRIELDMFGLEFDKDVGDRILKVIFVVRKQFDRNVLRFFFQTKHNQWTHDQRGDSSGQFRTIMEHCRSTRVAA